MAITVRPFHEGDRDCADAVISAHQGSSLTVRLGELVDPLGLPGLVAERDGRRLGLRRTPVRRAPARRKHWAPAVRPGPMRGGRPAYMPMPWL